MADAKSPSEERQRALARWEGEGGGLGRAAQAADSLDETELRMLTRLGAALLEGWNNMPTDLQRAIFVRASTPHGLGEGARLKSEIARFLHDHKDR